MTRVVPSRGASTYASGIRITRARRSLGSRDVTPPRNGPATSAAPGTVLRITNPIPARASPLPRPTSTAATVATMATPATSLSFPVHQPGNRGFSRWSLRARMMTKPKNQGRPSDRQRPLGQGGASMDLRSRRARMIFSVLAGPARTQTMTSQPQIELRSNGGREVR